MKSCNNCRNYDPKNLYCFSFHIKVIDDISAEVCKFYKEKKKVIENIKCVRCFYMNKYGYCSAKKQCVNDDEKFLNRKCRYFKEKKYRNK